MESYHYGYLDNPANGLDIIRARTLIGNLRLWDIPRREEALDIVINEIGHSPIPGIYLLFDERKPRKVYIGQSENLKNRLISHMRAPEDKIKNWERAIIINDNKAFERDTIDIFIHFDEDKILIAYKSSEINITSYSILPYLE